MICISIFVEIVNVILINNKLRTKLQLVNVQNFKHLELEQNLLRAFSSRVLKILAFSI